MRPEVGVEELISGCYSLHSLFMSTAIIFSTRYKKMLILKHCF